MKYKIKNQISKRELRKHGKNIIPLMKFTPEDVLEESELKRPRTDDGRIRKDNAVDKDVQCPIC